MAPVPVLKNVINSHFDEANDYYLDFIATEKTREDLVRYRREVHQRLIAPLEGLVLSGDYCWMLCQ